MTAKEYLSQARRLDEAINCRLRELEYWRGLSCRLSGCGFDEHHNPNPPTEAPFTMCLEKIDEIERDVNAKVDTLVDLRWAVNRVIDAMDNSDEQILLRCRYLDGLSWADICQIMNVSLRTVYRLHSTALDDFNVPDEKIPPS